MDAFKEQNSLCPLPHFSLFISLCLTLAFICPHSYSDVCCLFYMFVYRLSAQGSLQSLWCWHRETWLSWQIYLLLCPVWRWFWDVTASLGWMEVKEKVIHWVQQGSELTDMLCYLRYCIHKTKHAQYWRCRSDVNTQQADIEHSLESTNVRAPWCNETQHS